MLNELFFAAQFAAAWKADDIEKESLAKNSRAFGRQAEAQKKVEIHEANLFEKMKINAIRKNAILQYHIRKFIDVYRIIDEYHLNKGLGIKEMEKIEAVQTQLMQYVDLPAIAKGLARSDTQLAVQWALLGTVGLMMKDAKANSELASRNMANSRVVEAQADSICIFYDGLAEKVQVCTELLQKLAAKDIMSINHIESMLQSKGQDESLYTQDDVDAINLCSELNILIYEIINTPLIDENNQITQASIAIINKGREYIKQLG